ncbi:aldo/keto reductase [Sedimentibacter sp. zth1]|uniref:aldo/keto reductase n=1 Tax=Sedimentibacter sp. zth1 TaxID=2816908 RepID=UPI001A90E726|nr:aldo/keto reductase [Sedimentibacter sp. zth1]QSX05514.1 aldo/keto reductase [Sedimentibacter sp. zth1]
MKISQLDKMGVTLSKLGFGCMRFPNIDNVIVQDEVDKMIKYAHDNGINYFDTAYVYGGGNSEIALGKALKQLNREDFYVTDKMPLWVAKNEEDLDIIFDKALERLQLDYIDFYLLHALDNSVYEKIINYNVIDWAKKKIAEGKIKHLGFSMHDDYDFLVKVLDLYDFEFVQIQLNYLDIIDRPGLKGYEELEKRNIPVIIMEPLKGGLLSDLNDNIAAPFRELGGSNVSYAFRWLAEKKGIATILSGMSSMAQLKQNIEVFKNLSPLTEEENEAILKVEKNVIKLQKVKCTGCGYCMPCPFGVTIPELFKAWNTKSMNQSTNWISGTDINYEIAEKCRNCKKCVRLCPQHINIPQMLRQLVSEK